jgi:predicted lipoprotein
MFRNAEEVLSELISVPAEALEIIADRRLKPITPAEEGDRVNPKLGIFWRSGLTFVFVEAELDGLRAYFETSGLEEALPESERWLADSVRFEFSNSENVLEHLDAPIADIVADEEQRGALIYLTILTNSLRKLFGGQIAAALGLSVGFSSLDGD